MSGRLRVTNVAPSLVIRPMSLRPAVARRSEDATICVREAAEEAAGVAALLRRG